MTATLTHCSITLIQEYPATLRHRQSTEVHYCNVHTNFTDIVPQKRRLLLSLNVRFDEISDPRGLAADVTNLGLWGNGDVQLEVDNAR